MLKDNQRYAFVEDIRGTKLSMTLENKAWYKVRKGKAKVLNVKPLTIQLQYEVDNTDSSEIVLGLDVGQTTGVGIIQKCQGTKTKVLFKGEINHRKDISKLMVSRKGYRKLHRAEKRYRKARFNNRASSTKLGRITPSIKTRQDEITRFVNYLLKHLHVDKIVIEDVSFDIRVLTDGYKLYSWQYQKSNRLDENLRKATLMRDNFECQLCGKKDTILEAHHITPRRENGEDTIGNLITLCSCCHETVTNNEDVYKSLFYAKTRGKQLGLRYASHVMIGKTYLHEQLQLLTSIVEKTDGGTTANRRIDYNIDKTHSNDALLITGLIPNCTNIYEYTIKPLRKKRKVKIDSSNLGIVQGDRVWYEPRGKKRIECYVKAILKTGTHKGKYKLKDYEGNEYGPASIKSLKKISNERGLTIV